MRTVIVEDQPYAADRIGRLLKKVEPEIEVQAILSSVPDAVQWFSHNPGPDLIFMDVELDQEVCFKIFEQTAIDCPVIFTSAHTKYGMDAYHANAIHYLTKPITEESLRIGLDKYQQLRNSFLEKAVDGLSDNSDNEVAKAIAEKIILRVGKNYIPVAQSQIAYTCIRNGLTYLFMQDGTRYLVEQNLDELEKELRKDLFFRLNRQYLANINAVKYYSSFTRGRLKISLEPTIDDTVLVSFKKRNTFLEWIS